MFKTIAAGMAGAFRSIAAAVPGLLRELLGLSGIAAIAYGAWLVYEPAGFIVGGVLMVACVLLYSIFARLPAKHQGQ